ncbi:putative multidrug resistant protein [Rosellinia necatrix]|uniref:Putative multidrug resistant protein n=1 Tax=Rosellinia necatrix TaxID=77044 RepID=A0A1W2TN62_ROSNE|nr:putative multidrug resistant protein [Rosellinia necatrix]
MEITQERTQGRASNTDAQLPTSSPPAQDVVSRPRSRAVTWDEHIVARTHHDVEEESGSEPTLRVSELRESDCESLLGHAFPRWKKWWILAVIALIQISTRLNTSIYSDGVASISSEFSVSEQLARCGTALCTICYAFGCVLWAPWSEDFGRRPIIQSSLILVNIWSTVVLVAPDFPTTATARALGGLSTAGGSVTFGMVADIYDGGSQQYAVAFVIFSSVFGSILGPIIGDFVELLPLLAAWRWWACFQLVLGLGAQLLHFFTVPETRATVIMDAIAKKRREDGVDEHIYGPTEGQTFRARLSFRGWYETSSRALVMLKTEPIVLCLSLLSGYSNAIIVLQIQLLNIVYKRWHRNHWQTSLTFISMAIGYAIAWAIFVATFERDRRRQKERPHDKRARFESKLWLQIWLSLCLPFGGLLVIAWASLGHLGHWSIIFGLALVGVAHYSIYMVTTDCMICAYGPYSASAAGGNGLARDFLAGVLTPAAIPLSTNITTMGRLSMEGLLRGFCILGISAIAVVVCGIFIYGYIEVLHANSQRAQGIDLRHFEGGSRESLAISSNRSSAAVTENDSGSESTITPARAQEAPAPRLINIVLPEPIYIPGAGRGRLPNLIPRMSSSFAPRDSSVNDCYDAVNRWQDGGGEGSRTPAQTRAAAQMERGGPSSEALESPPTSL